MVIMPPSKKMKKSAVGSPADMETDECDAEEVPNELLVVAQEVKIVQALASNDLNKRNRQLKRLRKWLELRARSSFPFTDEDFRRIWKGLYYSMWMSDKPLVQEELAEQMGKLLECFNGNLELSIEFYGAFLRTMSQEWFGIDQWRMDKFLMLVRRMLRCIFRVLKDDGWGVENVQMFNKCLQKSLLEERLSPTGLIMHFLDIFFEELAKVSEGDISAKEVAEFVQPFIRFVGTNNRDFKLIFHCRKAVFYHLLYQSSLGREYSEKYNAWKEMGFPTTSINDLEKDESASQDEDDTSEPVLIKQNHLDPRAGNVDVFMPELQLDATYIIGELKALMYKEENNTKHRKMLRRLLDIFETYQKGTFPLGIKTMPRFELKLEKPLIKGKIEDLESLENEVYGTGRKLKQLTKRKRRKLLKSLNLDNADEDNFEQIVADAIPQLYLEQRQKRFKTMSGWMVEEPADDIVSKVQDDVSTIPEQQPTKLNKTKKKHEETELNVDEPARKIKKLENSPKYKMAQTVPNNTPKGPTITALSNGNGISPINTNKVSKTVGKNKKDVANAWSEPLAPGEIEYFTPSRKLKVRKANSNLVRNPLANGNAAMSSPKNIKKPTFASPATTPKTPSSVKRVKISLKRNTAQNPSEYIRQVKTSPLVPFDADKRPSKGLLKPNALPSPIDPFYKFKN